MTEKTLLRLDLPSAELPVVGKLFYQPISRQCITNQAQIELLKKRVLAAAIDGEALLLASTLRDLKKLGISPSDEMFYGFEDANPLHLAVEANSPATLCVLVDHGCDVNVKDRLGNTPAHHAARLNYIECIKILGSPQALADFSIKNNDGYTPSRLAYLGGHMEVVEVMQTLQSEDENQHMAKRSLAEAARQRKMVRMKETLYGRSFSSFEGGRDFEVPARALLSDDHILRVSANVRAFACVPAVIDAGMRKALAKLALVEKSDDGSNSSSKLEEVIEFNEQEGGVSYGKDHRSHDRKEMESVSMSHEVPLPKQRDQDEAKEVNIDDMDEALGLNCNNIDSNIREITSVSNNKRGEMSFDDFEDDFGDCFIPGRIATDRWVDFSKGRPPDLGYNSCV